MREGMAGALPTADHPFTGIMNAARKFAFSRTLNVTITNNTLTHTGGISTWNVTPTNRTIAGNTIN
jgi:hypothetical protein